MKTKTASSSKSSSAGSKGAAAKSNGSSAKNGSGGANGSSSKNGNGSRNGSSGTKSSSAKKSSGGQATKASSEAAAGLRDLFEDMLKDIYWAEKALTKALPKMAKNATSEELIACLQDHLAVTEEQVKRLEQVFQAIGKTARAKKCEAMEGLIKEAEEIMENTEEGMVRDAGIIAAGQKVEHYEIATYGTLASFARTLGEDEVAGMLEQTLDEEKEADQTLTTVAESAVNIGAADEDDDDSEDEDDSDDSADDDTDDEEADDDNGSAKSKTASKKR